ncbi:MAG: GntR family transcriptional regulator [Tumebacillaceae bacterium]
MLNKNIPIPLYYQLKERLTQQIMGGDFQPGTLMPSERELSDRYGISRMTVRQALGEMVKEGLLLREQGKGTFVAEPKITQGLLRLTSFSEDMQSRGLKPDSHVRAVYVQDTPPVVAAALGLAEKSQVIVLERVRLADQKPMAFEVTHVPVMLFPGLVQEDLHTSSLYTILEEKYGVKIKYARQSIEVGLSNRVESDCLGISIGSPVLKMERVTYDADEHSFEVVKSVYRGDRYKLHVELHR